MLVLPTSSPRGAISLTPWLQPGVEHLEIGKETVSNGFVDSDHEKPLETVQE
jgi:hypothetical protein